MEGRDAFRKALVVSRNETDVNRIDIVLSPDVINELRILGQDIQFIL